MLPADLQRAERYWRCSLGESPCRELGLICWVVAGEFGVLEAGELLWEEAPGSRISINLYIKLFSCWFYFLYHKIFFDLLTKVG